jgi:Family of unknown function (DUF6526)
VTAETPQNFQNHAKVVPGFLYGVLGVLTINSLWSLRRLIEAPSFDSALAVAVSFALIGTAFYARTFALTVQDRVIRLEMRQRLREVLPAELHARIGELTRRQLVALRFAGDAELPELTRRVLAGELKDGKSIKQNVRDWQADHLRA